MPIVHSVLAVAVGGVLGLVLGRTWPTIVLTVTVCLGVRIGLASAYTNYVQPTEYVAPNADGAIRGPQ